MLYDPERVLSKLDIKLYYQAPRAWNRCIGPRSVWEED